MFKTTASTSLLLLLLLATCAHQPSNEFIYPSQLYAERDTAGLSRSIIEDHAGVRRALNQSLQQFIASRAGTDSLLSDSILLQCRWFTGLYTKQTGLMDISRKLDIYSGWSSTEASKKLSLDSSFRKNRNISDRTQRIAALHELNEDYREISDSFQIAAVCYKMGIVFKGAGIIDSAVWYGDTCLSYARALGHRRIAGLACLLLGQLYDGYFADYLKAEKLLTEGEQWFQSVDDKRGLAEVRLNRAYCRADRYDSELAISGFHEVLNDFENLKNRLKIGCCLYELAESFLDIDQLDSARFYADSALQIQRQLNKRYASESGSTLSVLALISSEQGDSLSALRFYHLADSVFVAAADTTGLCLNAVRTGGFLLNTGQIKQARKLFEFTRQTTQSFEETLGSIFGLAVCDYLEGKSAAALDKLRLCIRRHEVSSLKLPVPQAKTGMLSDRIGFYNLAATIFAKQYEHDKSDSLIDSVFHYVERGKAQALRDMLETKPTSMHSGMVEPLLERISQIDNKLLLGVGDSSVFNAEIFRLEDSLQQLQFALTTETGPTALQAFSASIDLQQVKGKYLKPGDLILEYLVSEFGCFLISATNEAVTLRRLDADVQHIGNDVAALISYINQYPSTPTPPEEYNEVCRRLGQLLIPTGVLSPERTQRILVIPDGPLCRLPFETLISTEDRLLVENFDVSYASSMTVLDAVATRSRRSLNVGVVVFADPATDSAVVASLPSSRREIEALRATFGPDRVDAYFGVNASKARFKALDYKRTRYLHIATHGLVDERHIQRSALVFAADTAGRENSLLQAHEIATMNIPVDLVFLSACGTGAGKNLPGEGVMNLAQPFLVAGARSIIATDWNVDDRGATRFVTMFYSQLAAGEDKLHSFAKAKRDFLTSDILLYRHPFFWAPWRLIGVCK